MYRVIVKDRGEYGNVVPGTRYCFRKKSVAELVVIFSERKCDFTVERLVRIHGDIFSWTGNNISEKIWDLAKKILDKSKQK